MSELGAGSDTVAPQALTVATQEKLGQLVARIQRLEAEKKAQADDIKLVYAEAKTLGFDVKVLRQVIRLLALRPQEREEADMVRDLYLHALGMV